MSSRWNIFFFFFFCIIKLLKHSLFCDLSVEAPCSAHSVCNYKTLCWKPSCIMSLSLTLSTWHLDSDFKRKILGAFQHDFRTEPFFFYDCVPCLQMTRYVRGVNCPRTSGTSLAAPDRREMEWGCRHWRRFRSKGGRGKDVPCGLGSGI